MAGICASWSTQRWQVPLFWFLFFCTENIIHRLVVSWSLHPSPTPLTSRLLCEHFPASTISLMVCAVATFLSFFFFPLICVVPWNFFSSKAQHCVPRAVTCKYDSPMQWIVCFQPFLLQFLFVWTALPAFLLFPWALPFRCPPCHLLWGCRSGHPVWGLSQLLNSSASSFQHNSRMLFPLFSAGCVPCGPRVQISSWPGIPMRVDQVSPQ